MITRGPEETKETAKKFVADLAGSKLPEQGATIVELVGDLGAGKTTFMGGVGEFFGIKEAIISPTFLIQRNYKIEGNFPWKNLVHLDAYRIENGDELRGINWEKYSSNPENLIFVEWPENLRTSFPATKRIEFKHLSENEREIQI